MLKKFTDWFEEHLADYASDIANYGCDAGFPYITYTTDCVDLYNEYEDEIYEALAQDAEEFGYPNVDCFVCTFNRSDMLNDPDQRKNLLLWYAVERVAREVADNE